MFRRAGRERIDIGQRVLEIRWGAGANSCASPPLRPAVGRGQCAIVFTATTTFCARRSFSTRAYRPPRSHCACLLPSSAAFVYQCIARAGSSSTPALSYRAPVVRAAEGVLRVHAARGCPRERQRAVDVIATHAARAVVVVVVVLVVRGGAAALPATAASWPPSRPPRHHRRAAAAHPRRCPPRSARALAYSLGLLRFFFLAASAASRRHRRAHLSAPAPGNEVMSGR